MMEAEHYKMEASLYYAKGASSSRKALVLRRFAKAAEAIRFAVEDLQPKLLGGCSLEVEESYYFGQEIRPLYDHQAFPLRRRTKSISGKRKQLESALEAPKSFSSATAKVSAIPFCQSAALAIEQAILRQGRMMEGYCFNLPRGDANVRDMILEDIGRFSDLGVRRHVSDLFEVLKRFDLAHPPMPA
jgi:hypothetical protein